LRSTGPQEGEWDEADEVYNTPEATRARIAIDVQALREEVWILGDRYDGVVKMVRCLVSTDTHGE
jgi:hypothetical protein